MGQKKLIRFAAIAGYPHVLQYPTGMKGQWNIFYKNDNPRPFRKGIRNTPRSRGDASEMLRPC